MNKARIISILNKGRKDQIDSDQKIIHNIHGWEVSYNKVGKVFVAEKGSQRVIRSNEAILAGILASA